MQKLGLGEICESIPGHGAQFHSARDYYLDKGDQSYSLTRPEEHWHL